MKFTEAQLESAIIELLETEGYPHILREAIECQPKQALTEIKKYQAKVICFFHKSLLQVVKKKNMMTL